MSFINRAGRRPTKQTQSSIDSEISRMLSSPGVETVGNYVLGRTIGEGTFAKVKLASHKLTSSVVAVKIVDKTYAPAVAREIETWRQVSHPNIAQLYEVLTTESKIYMVSEYVAGGELYEYISKHGRMDDKSSETKRIYRQIVEAVEHCHVKNYVHRDLKMENILLTPDMNIKLIDFGFTRECTKSSLLETYCGSLAYVAPEVINGTKYSGPPADIWSLGVILYTMVVGYLPFDDDNESVVQRKIVNGEFDVPSFLTPECRELIVSILVESKHRPTMAEILGHPWLQLSAGSTSRRSSISSSRRSSLENGSLSSSSPRTSGSNLDSSSGSDGSGKVHHRRSSNGSLRINTKIVTPKETHRLTSSTSSSTSPVTAAFLNNDADSVAVLSALSELGFDTNNIVRSVTNNTVDSLSALYHLLLAKRKAAHSLIPSMPVSPGLSSRTSLAGSPHPLAISDDRLSPILLVGGQQSITESTRGDAFTGSRRSIAMEAMRRNSGGIKPGRRKPTDGVKLAELKETIGSDEQLRPSPQANRDPMRNSIIEEPDDEFD